MTLWTIQPLERYEQLLKTGSICGEEPFIEPIFLDSYHWMLQKMEERIGKQPFSDCYPVWAWYQYNGVHKKKPDLPHNCLLPKGTKGVCIEISKNENEVLLSDFVLWHSALNKFFIGINEEDGLAFEVALDKLEEQGIEPYKFDKLPRVFQQKMIESWDKIFDLEFDDPYYSCPKAAKSIQATFWTLSIHEVVSVMEFVAR